MRALCNREGLLNAFGMVSGVAPTRSPKPILQNLKLVVAIDGPSTLLATDMEVGIRYEVLGVRAEQPGSVILPTQRIQQILKTTKDPDIWLELEGDQLLVRGLNFRFRLPSEDVTLYPDVALFDAKAFHVVSAGDLRKLIRRTMFATEPESTRYALGGVLFEFGAREVTLVGTDGRRLAHAVAAAEAENDPETSQGQQPVVPVKALKLLERNLDDEVPVHIAFPNAGTVLVRTGSAVISSRLVEGRFPRYRDVFPAPPEVKIAVEVGSFRARIEQAAIVTNDESRGVDFQFHPGMLTLVSQSPDLGSSQVEMPISHEGKNVDIVFDPHYLLDALKVLDDDVKLTVELIDDKSAAVLRTEDQYTYIVMPLTRDR